MQRNIVFAVAEKMETLLSGSEPSKAFMVFHKKDITLP
tara:strand:- start:138 stop:251 length:114 start_codon:yes stop_codon:yes gene_type:complete